MYDMLDLVGSLKTVAEFTRAGMIDEAAALRAGLVDLIDGEIRPMFRNAQDSLETDPANASKWLFFCLTALREYEPYVGSLSIAQADCLDLTVRLFQSLGQEEVVRATQSMLAQDFTPFYPMSASCQIGMLDALYQRCFGRRTSGQFVEVGAFDGETFSNTCGLADIGWRGLYIEPMPGSFEKCRARHDRNPAVTTVNLAMGSAAGTAFMVDKGALTQISEQSGQGAVEVHIRRLDDVLVEQGVAAEFDLLVVDVEGFEGEVFAGFDLARWSPLAIIIELSELGPLDEMKRPIRDRILGAGYRLIFQDAINSLYVRSPLLQV